MPRYSAKINKRGSGNYIPVVVETDSRSNAEELLNTQYPGHDVYFLEEVAPEDAGQGAGIARQEGGTGSARDGCLGAVLGIVCIVGYLTYRAVIPGDPAPQSTPPVQAPADVAVASAPGDPDATAARHDTPATGVDEVGDGAASIPAPQAPASTSAIAPSVGEWNGFPFPARIVDHRAQVVLQSGPGITSRNVTKLATGATVHAGDTEGKWIRVKTEEGLIGFVRRKQLDFTPVR